MSGRELIESLRKAGDEKAGMLRQEAEAAAREMRAGLADRLARLRADRERDQSLAANAALSARVSEANNQARRSRLIVEQALADRLFAAAGSSLRRLRDEGYPRVFEMLAWELPFLTWNAVRVNPSDVETAKRVFPDAEIVPDETISGGMDASTEDGAVRVINTFEKRLERAWPDLLPLLIRDVYGEMGDGPSDKS
jgi:V/A-type H+-transporting ATPase subunit E